MNNLTLFFVCFLPFPTAMMVEYPENRVALLMFGAVASAASLMQTWMYHYITKYYLLDRYDKVKARKNVKRSFILAPMMLIIATAASFVYILLPYLIYALVPFFFLLPFDRED